MTSIARISFAVCALGSVLVGCLFPSVDGFGGAEVTPGGAAPATTKASDDAGAPAAPSPGDVKADAAAPDAAPGPLPAPLPTPAIACGTKSCNAASTYCCVAWGSSECKPNAEGPFCEAVLRCDGNQDCAPGLKCCGTTGAGSDEATCRSDCGSDKILCKKAAPECPTGQTCTGTIDQGNGVTSSFCK